MKKLLLILILISAFSGLKAQTWTRVLARPGYQYNGLKVDSILILPTDTTRNKVNGSMAIKDTTAFYKTSKGWFKIASFRSLKFKIDSLSGKVYSKAEIDAILTGKQNLLINPIVQADSTVKYVTPYQLLEITPKSFETLVTTAGISQINLPFTLKSTALVWYNGSIISKNLWTGANTTTLTLFLDTKQKDLFIIQNQ